MQHHLTAQNVGSLPARGHRTDYFASSPGAPAGFCLRVSSTGHRSYALFYRSKRTQRLLRVTIGNAGEVTLASARERARKLRAEIQLGLDRPAETEGAASTVADVLSAFIEAPHQSRQRGGLGECLFEVLAPDDRIVHQDGCAVPLFP